MGSSASVDPLPFPVSGAVLAGGRSSRMGTDKAFLLAEGLPLVARQCARLRSLGIDDVLVSGRVGIDYAPAVPDVRVVYDAVPDTGPLGGLAAALSAARNDWVMIVAVDLPSLTPDYLRRLLIVGGGLHGAVPEGTQGFEPLVALYPKALLPWINKALHEKQYQLQRLVRTAVDKGLMTRVSIAAEEQRLFANWNTPDDISP